MNKIRGIIIISSSLALIAVAVFWLYETYFGFYVTAKFSTSGPLAVNMPVYYKGFEIGKIKKIEPSKNYKYTFVKIILYPKDIKLTENVVAKAKMPNSKNDYIDLVPPDFPSDKLLKNGDIIDGEPAFDMESFLSDIATSGIVVPLLQNFSDTAVSLNKTSTEIRNFFAETKDVVDENRKNLNLTTKGMAQTSQSLTKLTSRLNNSITDDKIKNTTSNVDKSSTNILSATERIKTIAANVECVTRNLGQTMCKVDSTLTNANATVENTKAITGGLRQVLAKRFAGLRIIFGKPLKNDCCNP